MEIWKAVKDTDYKVSNEGNIMKPDGKIIKFRSQTYRKCDLGLVHRIVAYYFCNPPKEVQDNWVCPGYEIHHINNCCWDNRAENLEYLTYEEHKAKHQGTHTIKNNKEELTIKDVAYLFLENLRIQ